MNSIYIAPTGAFVKYLNRGEYVMNPVNSLLPYLGSYVEVSENVVFETMINILSKDVVNYEMIFKSIMVGYTISEAIEIMKSSNTTNNTGMVGVEVQWFASPEKKELLELAELVGVCQAMNSDTYRVGLSLVSNELSLPFSLNPEYSIGNETYIKYFRVFDVLISIISELSQ